MRLEIDKYLFHPLEIAFCGYSGSGKTTLIKKLIEKFAGQGYSVGYIKHDAHKFQMDREGKDTFTAHEAGASRVAISSKKACALLLDIENEELTFRQNFVDSDLVFIEGYKKEICRKILLCSGDARDEELLKTIQGLRAIVGPEERSSGDSIPYFHRNDLSGIFSFVEQTIKALCPLYGLILAGGHSKRMGQDKYKINYHGKPQVDYLSELLGRITQRVYLSCRADQQRPFSIEHIPTIEDRFVGMGPIGGILSAFHQYPNTAWLVVACDMPFIDEEMLTRLIQERDPLKMVSCFYNEEKKWPEPLCSIYEPKSAFKLLQCLALGLQCPRKILTHSPIKIISPPSQHSLNNINNPQELETIRKEATL